MTEQQRSTRQIVWVVALFWTVSISLVFINKRLLGGTFSLTDISIFVAWYQCLASVTVINVLGFISKHLKLGFSTPEVNIDILLSSDFLKLGFAFVFGLTLNNLMLKHISVAFYQVARSFTLVFTVILSWTMLKKPLSKISILCCIIVLSGFLLSIDQEDNAGTLSVWGIIYGTLASLCTAICGIYFKQVDPLAGSDSLKIAYYNNINSVIIFTPLVLSTGQFHSVMSSPLAFDAQFWILLTITGGLSLSMGWVSVLQINYTSPTSHHISNTAKSVFQTILAVSITHERKTGLWWLGNVLVGAGVLVYAVGQMRKVIYTVNIDKQPESDTRKMSQ